MDFFQPNFDVGESAASMYGGGDSHYAYAAPDYEQHHEHNLYDDNDHNFARQLLKIPFIGFNTNTTRENVNQSSFSTNKIHDVSVNAALTAIEFNCVIFVLFMGAYELFSRFVPSVYAGRTINATSGSARKKGSLLPRSVLPLGWATAVARTSWPRVLECGGLDAYMFLRYIRMCLQISAVSGFWGMAILWPIYATSEGEDTTGWYLLSMANVAPGSWRIWFPTMFMWLLSFFTIFVMNEEYKHYVEKRMDWLSGRDDVHEDIHPQHKYSLMVEGIPNSLRSDKALYEYFDKLFPGKVHSACMVLFVPDLEAVSQKRTRIRRRLEKSIAYQEATGRRPIHVVGRRRVMCCGIDSISSYGGKPGWTGTEEDNGRPPERGERVDSINYYWRELKEVDKEMEELQEEKLNLALTRNDSVRASEYISQAIEYATDTAVTTLEGGQRDDGLLLDWHFRRGAICSVIMKMGFDFVFAGFSLLYPHIDVVADQVAGTTMTSTGFVTFNDMASVTCAASAPLSQNADSLSVAVAPELRDIYWENAHADILWSTGRTWTANVLLGLGAILWSIPLTFIQALASIESLAQIPGLNWLSALASSPFAGFINGYLPVLALLGLIMILPIIFEAVAVKYEVRKTKSSVESSILGRFFYYQLANIYVTVTAGSIWESLAAILEHPSNALSILGRSFPTVVGYFVTLLMTKTLAGLPVVLLRLPSLSRMLFLKFCFRESKLTQRELDEVYKKEMLKYGWEYPTQLLVVIICFTYACISPIILPVGAIYFVGALIVYKKQVLYVYTPLYEGGGALFPSVCHRTLIGLVCGQITLTGYTIIKSGYTQSLVLLPLPILTLKMMNTFKRTYADHSMSLSLERALELDKHTVAVSGFSDNAYRQPVLTETASGPLPYRRDRASDDDDDGCTGDDAMSVHNPLGFSKASNSGKAV